MDIQTSRYVKSSQRRQTGPVLSTEHEEIAMPELAPEVQDLIARTDAMMAAVQAAGPLGGGTMADLRAAADAAIADLFAAAGGELSEVARVEDHRVAVDGG